MRIWFRSFFSCPWNFCLQCDGKVFTAFIAECISVHANFEAQFPQGLAAGGVVVTITDRASPVKAPPAAALFALLASGRSVW